MENKNTSRKIEKKDTFDLKQIVELVLKNKKWFILSVGVCLIAGVFYLLVKNPVYYVDASILLKEEDSKSKSGAMSALSGLADLGSMMGSRNVDNEVGVLQTRMILKQSLMDLNMHVVCETKKGLRTIDVYPDFPFNITVNSIQVDTIKRAIEFKMKPLSGNQYQVKGEYDSEKFETVITKFPAIVKTPSIDVYISQNPDLKPKKDQSFKVTISNPNVMTNKLSKIINIGATSKKTSIINLGLEADNVKKAQDLLTKLIERFNKEALNDKNQEARNTANFVDGRLIVIADELEKAEVELEEYKRKNNLIDIWVETKIILEQKSKTQLQQNEFQIQLGIVEYLEDFLKDNKNINKTIPSVGIEDKSLLGIIVKYNELLMEKNRIESSSSENNPSLSVMNLQLTSMRQNILTNVKNVKESLKVAIADIKTEGNTMDDRMKLMPQQEKELVEIYRQKGIKEELFIFLLKKKEEANLSLATTAPKAKTIDVPMPSIKPVSPKKLTSLAIAFVLGLGIPFVILYLLKTLNTKIDSKEELERLCVAEVIGEISQSKSKKHIVVKKDSTSPEVELFRLLRANIFFKIRGTDKKVIMITSTIAGEGKTFIGTNLALSIALTGKKVLLAGLDIRKPRLAEYLGVPKVQGITDYLSETGYTPISIVHKSEIHPNLDILQAGTIPPNPNELLMEEKLDDLFDYYRTIYDYILIDTAPVGIVSDTFLLDRIADITLYVNRIGYVYKESVKNINAIIEKNSLKNLYVVANGINLGEKNGGYGYGYGQK